jgi:hypothetical protein
VSGGWAVAACVAGPGCVVALTGRLGGVVGLAEVLATVWACLGAGEVGGCDVVAVGCGVGAAVAVGCGFALATGAASHRGFGGFPVLGALPWGVALPVAGSHQVDRLRLLPWLRPLLSFGACPLAAM